MWHPLKRVTCAPRKTYGESRGDVDEAAGGEEREQTKHTAAGGEGGEI